MGGSFRDANRTEVSGPTISLGGRVDRVIVNDGPFQPDVLQTYAEEKSEPVTVDRAQLARLVPNVVIEHLNLEDDRLARHDPERLVRAIFPNDEF